MITIQMENLTKYKHEKDSNVMYLRLSTDLDVWLSYICLDMQT
jgi:hypothetical protein